MDKSQFRWQTMDCAYVKINRHRLQIEDVRLEKIESDEFPVIFRKNSISRWVVVSV